MFQKFFLSLLMCCFSHSVFAQESVEIATFDSGFGGYFTAKSIEHLHRKLLKIIMRLYNQSFWRYKKYSLW